MSLFGQPTAPVVEETYKSPAITPFEFINAIHHSKENLIVDEWSEKQYNPYIINKGLSYGHDTVIPANEMNSRPHLDKVLQFHFLSGIIRPKKRFNKWIKAEVNSNLNIVKEYYGYSNDKAKQVLPLFSKDILEKMRESIFKGGRSKN